MIIGASSEVGMAFIRLLEQEACRGALSDVHLLAHYGSHPEGLYALEQECSHLTFEYLSCDLSNEQQVKHLADALREKEAVQGFLYLAAEKMRYEKLKKMDMDRLDRSYQIQVHALAEIAKAVLPMMAKEKFGKAVVMLSECTLGMPPKFAAEYVTVKYAALGLMRALSLEYADKHVNVNGLSPAMMETKFLSELEERLVEMNAAANVIKRNATVQEAARAIAFLLSSGADYMNGVNLNLTGGNQV